ncbi:unnamed protein product [Rotaria sordida]|uniref:G-protein coupled receptors family 1 profile domain-containing protein n=1 Tax=Rotaria sordida TaxID=392033 RepID=A0A818GN48_9BILA|nr:unnamed protein product [Rotaria sordida]CAF0752725.1 unnamed protein product [Rotaria sordida]CAF0774965.1 unnamed protein product [Rotaria sordida]CAF0801810.1 unnamed protein product [Rotaria sordida]CAF3494752.1 unnamed protein product [Rotaria sordida]
MSTESNNKFDSDTRGLPPPSILALLDQDTQSLFALIKILLKVYPVLIFILGSFGNLLSFCVLIRSAMRRYSTFCYLACLALVDLGVIITFCVNFISLYHFDHDIQDGPLQCKLFAFCTYFLPQYSSWILVAVSIDRVISAKYLRLAKTWTKPKHSVLVTFILGLFLAILNSHFFLYENNSMKQRNQHETAIPNEQQRIFNNNTDFESYSSSNGFDPSHGQYGFFNILSGSGGDLGASDSSLSYEPYTSVPIESISRDTTLQDKVNNFKNTKQKSEPFFDVNVIHCSLENSIEHEKLYRYWVWIDLAMNVFIPFTAMIACTIIIILTLVRSSSRAGSTSARRSRRRRNISVMLITVNLVFISLTAPIVIFLSIYEYVKDDNNYYRHTILVLIKIFCIILMNLNHSVNIVIYSVTAREFRSEMANFLHALLYCIIGKPTTSAGLAYIHDDGTLLSRIRRFRHDVFKCCRMKIHSNSTNTTDSSGLQHTTIPPGTTNTRFSNSNKKINKCKRLERNGNRKCSIVPNSEPLIHKNNHRLTVQLQADASSSVYEREDISIHGLSVSTED